jgi:hypothetical protein
MSKRKLPAFTDDDRLALHRSGHAVLGDGSVVHVASGAPLAGDALHTILNKDGTSGTATVSLRTASLPATAAVTPAPASSRAVLARSEGPPHHDRPRGRAAPLPEAP